MKVELLEKEITEWVKEISIEREVKAYLSAEIVFYWCEDCKEEGLVNA